jgi:hypothetical protein
MKNRKEETEMRKEKENKERKRIWKREKGSI